MVYEKGRISGIKEFDAYKHSDISKLVIKENSNRAPLVHVCDAVSSFENETKKAIRKIRRYAKKYHYKGILFKEIHVTEVSPIFFNKKRRCTIETILYRHNPEFPETL
tara:strand:+ start:155 stop:478 length:324 start_codon:yes stop_codon:yes gene_type:complete